MARARQRPITLTLLSMRRRRTSLLLNTIETAVQSGEDMHARAERPLTASSREKGVVCLGPSLQDR
jgi:hypothetical protein